MNDMALKLNQININHNLNLFKANHIKTKPSQNKLSPIKFFCKILLQLKMKNICKNILVNMEK